MIRGYKSWIVGKPGSGLSAKQRLLGKIMVHIPTSHGGYYKWWISPMLDEPETRLI
jgi:hypothetical protein